MLVSVCFFSFSDSFYDKLQGWPAWQTHARAEHSRDSKQANNRHKQQHWLKRTCWNPFRNNWIFAWFHPKHLLDNCTERFVCSCYVFSMCMHIRMHKTLQSPPPPMVAEGFQCSPPSYFGTKKHTLQFL